MTWHDTARILLLLTSLLLQVDKYNRNRVWATTRLTGTHNGPLVFDGKV